MIEKLIKGEVENLRGTVTAFVDRVVRSDIEEGLPCIFATADVGRLQRKKGLPTAEAMMAEEIIRKAREQTEANLPSGFGTIGMCSTYYLARNREVILNFEDEDIIEITDLRPDNCLRGALRATATKYIMAYGQQQRRKEQLENRERTNQVRPESYLEVPKEGGAIRRILLDEFVRPLRDLYKTNQTERASEIEARLAIFINGSDYAGLVLDMTKAIRLTAKQPDQMLVGNYLDLVSAVHEEKYEEAASLRDRIANLRRYK